jgi:hypothetical protein
VSKSHVLTTTLIDQSMIKDRFVLDAPERRLINIPTAPSKPLDSVEIVDFWGYGGTTSLIENDDTVSVL